MPGRQIPGVDWDENPERHPIDPSTCFDGFSDIWLEIGFGGGEHLLAQALANPDVAHIGCEPFVNGVAKLLSALEEAPVANLWIHPGDARDLLDVLPSGCLARVFLLYPDPWPKSRHHGRRFVKAETIDPLAHAMASGAHLRIGTDINDYVRHTLAHMIRRTDFRWCAEGPADWRIAWPDWTQTRYEAKALREGRRSTYLTFEKQASDTIA